MYNSNSLTSDEDESSKQSCRAIPKEISMINDLCSTWKLQKEIYEMATKKKEEILRLKREELYKCHQHSREMIESVSSDFQYVVENMPHIQRICNAQIGENSQPIPRHLHRNTVALFKTVAIICNNYEHIAKTFSKAQHVDFCKVLKRLSEAVYNKDFKILKQEIVVVEKCLDLLKPNPVNEGKESAVENYHVLTYNESDLTEYA